MSQEPPPRPSEFISSSSHFSLKVVWP